jgi:hypothetical protein
MSENKKLAGSTISLYINGMVVYEKIYTYSLYPKSCVLQKEL